MKYYSMIARWRWCEIHGCRLAGRWSQASLLGSDHWLLEAELISRRTGETKIVLLAQVTQAVGLKILHESAVQDCGGYDEENQHHSDRTILECQAMRPQAPGAQSTTSSALLHDTDCQLFTDVYLPAHPAPLPCSFTKFPHFFARRRTQSAPAYGPSPGSLFRSGERRHARPLDQVAVCGRQWLGAA